MRRTSEPALVWFRDDLRLADHPALDAAATSGRPLLCVYVLDDRSEGLRPLGGASRWWLHHSLLRLDEDLRARGSRLHLFQGAAQPIITALLKATKARALYHNRRYPQAERRIDAAIAEVCRAEGVAVHEFVGSVLHEPWEVVPKTGGFYKIFTPYWKAAVARGPAPPPVAAPASITPFHCPSVEGGPVTLPSLGLLPTVAWDTGLRQSWHPGERGASKALELFLHEKLDTYAVDRDRLGVTGSSRLSPHLRFGEISPRQVIAALERHGSGPSTPKFAAELGWRDFNTALLFHVPDLATTPFHKAFESFPYAKAKPSDLDAWRRGRTGYPIVDAGMRQLWQTGTMHNRVRMIAASFLVKHLLADWRIGEQWFWDTLCDADPANNPVNWQWIAGCGNDPVPYFRIFNPVLQGEKFDGGGDYARRFVPELAKLPDRWIHKPWDAPRSVLAEAGVTLEETYPAPIIDHTKARARALDALRRYRASRDQGGDRPSAEP